MTTATQPEQRSDYALKHFLRLARRGGGRGCSGGECRSRHIADAIVDNICTLDDLAIDGLIEFLRGAKQNPELARDLIERP